MCGIETPSSTPRVGARVDFFPAAGLAPTHLPFGNLLFLNPSSPSSSHATHVRFHHQKQQSKPASPQLEPLDESVLVSIHMTGDLTKPLSDAGLMRQFTLQRAQAHAAGEVPDMTMQPLDEAVALDVGHGGIIGRRVSVRRRGGEVLADGIVGFNFAPVPVSGVV